MYLKKIEVQGFKSFANKLVFEFNDGITGIVGPNGSGKSNIADAVRWVLGEQSAKQLRGAKMEDVIFAGTEQRKPVSFASVSLTMDNSDHKLNIEYDEITVTRRVFRSGGSEYLINGAPCRLKDINELFYDTGIGKEGYSIIGQGQIDKILSGKPEERRELFDEAAGIVKFKNRKAAAQKSLDNESANLVRISDILAELEKQVGPLKRQSEKAREYLKLKENLKKYEVNLFLYESDALKTELNSIVDKINIVNDDLEKTNEEFEKIKAVYDEKNQKIEDISARIEDLNSMNNQAEINKNRLISQIDILKEQINSANQSDAHLADRIQSINDQIDERNEEKNNLMTQKNNLSEIIDDVYGRKNESDRNVTELTNKIEQYTNEAEDDRNTYYTNLNRRGTINSNIQRYTTMLEQINIRKAELTSKLLGYKTDEGSFDKEVNDLKNNLDKVNSEIDALNLDNKKLNDICGEIRNHRSELNNKLNEARESNMRSTSRLETLSNIAERYDGYGNSIRKVMECKDRKKGIIGVVADIIKTEKKYEIAIETALGGTIQNIVTDDESTAKEMIAYLKTNRYGRATFLPLAAISGKNIRRETISGEKGFIGYASELVNTDAKYHELAEYLLGRTLVVDNIDNALQINRKHSHSLKIVTLEGELLNPGGSMTGGAFKNNSNLLGRRREIEDLEKLILTTQKNIETIKTELNAEEVKLNSSKNKITENNNVLQEKLIERNTAELGYNQVLNKRNEIKNLYEDNRREDKEIESQIKDINENLAKLRNELKQLEDENSVLSSNVENKTKLAEELKLDLSEKNKEAEKIHIEYSSISQKSEFIEESIKRVLREIARLKESINELEDNKNDSQNEIDTRNKEIEQIYDTIKVAEKTIAGYVEELNSLKTQKDELTISIKSFFDSREECQKTLVELEKEQFKLNQTKEKIESTRDNRIDYMWNEYEITLSQAASMKDEELTDQNEMRKSVNTIKNDIRKLGDVNVNSIEDYKEVAERYEFLKNQHDDLLLAKEKLIKIIEELDIGMRETFTEKFEQIRTEFDKVYKQLFGGGKGTIELEEDVDILEANISIISQPPGKKLANMMQLSGGEKALTAIGILFAIQNLKPSPFCLLDEIEAALDDTNVDRFANYLHKLTDNTQFIVITHRRGTMSAADRLYGITMQEKGVSTLVSVDLIDNELDEKSNE